MPWVSETSSGHSTSTAAPSCLHVLQHTAILHVAARAGLHVRPPARALDLPARNRALEAPPRRTDPDFRYLIFNIGPSQCRAGVPSLPLTVVHPKSALANINAS